MASSRSLHTVHLAAFGAGNVVGLGVMSMAGIGVGITGIAGPGGSEHKPEGRVCFGVARKGRETRVETVEFGARGRAKVREAAMRHALEMLTGAME